MESNFDGLSPKENINLPKTQWRSSYNPVALTTLEKITSEKIRSTRLEATDDDILKEVKPKQEKLGRYLDAIDKEVADNFEVFESQEHPGVRFSHSLVDVNKVAGLVHSRSSNQEQEKGPRSKLTYVIFTGYQPLPGGDPDDEIHAVYDRVLTVLPEIKTRPDQDIELHVLGLPTSRWGSVTEEWIKGLEKGALEKHSDPKEYKKSEYGFSQHGSLYAEFLKTVLNKNQDPQSKERVMFYGSSMGAVLASETAKKLPEIWNRLRVLVDVPTGAHQPTGKTIKLPFVGEMPFSGKGIQATTLFPVEALIRMAFDPLVKQSLGGKNAARQAFVDLQKERGMIPHDSDQENKLKKNANWQQIKLLIRGTPFDTDSFRSYVVQGMRDPATMGLKQVLSFDEKGKKFFKAGNRSLGMGINYTHWMDRGRWLGKWIRNIEQYEK